VAFSPDGKRFATAGQDREVKVWNTASGKEVLTVAGHKSGKDWDSATCVAFSPEGKRIASVDSRDSAKVWDADTGKELHQFKRKGGFYSVCFSRDGKRLATGGDDSTVCVWDVKE
jgi:WD40 repeat protein